MVEKRHPKRHIYNYMPWRDKTIWWLQISTTLKHQFRAFCVMCEARRYVPFPASHLIMGHYTTWSSETT